jgi:hypothetical protein
MALFSSYLLILSLLMQPFTQIPALLGAGPERLLGCVFIFFEVIALIFLFLVLVSLISVSRGLAGEMEQLQRKFADLTTSKPNRVGPRHHGFTQCPAASKFR